MKKSKKILYFPPVPAQGALRKHHSEARSCSKHPTRGCGGAPDLKNSIFIVKKSSSHYN